jgi:hypothetical protein
MLKYENLTLKIKIYIWTIKHYTDIDTNCWLRISCQQNRLRNSDKNSYLEKFEATKCVFRSCNFLNLSKELNMFLLLRTTVMCTVVYRNIMKLHRFSCYFFIRHRDFQSTEITGYTVCIHNNQWQNSYL